MKISKSLFVLISIIVQLVSIPLIYAFFAIISSILRDSSFELNLYFLSFPVVNYVIIFSVIIVTAIQETTKSELLASVMNGVWVLFIYSETSDAFRNRPYEYVLFLLCIALTIPIRIAFRNKYHT